MSEFIRCDRSDSEGASCEKGQLEQRIAELESQLATADARAVSLNADNGRLNDLLGEAQTRLQRIAEWCDAYPLNQFREPDMSMVSELLGSKLLSELSAYNYRHVLNGMRAIAKGGA